MATFKLEIVTVEKLSFSDNVNVLVAPGVNGQLGILPNHAPLMTILEPGELIIKKGSEETYWAITGGFLEVRPDKVIVLADACELATEIDISRAEEAKRRAEERLKQKSSGIDVTRAETALRRSLIRLKIAERHR
ncbi:MAG: F0F1 ATP synthase subunit epsilon [bacterium]|nr:F0F1 ATP synthase subunit epsilon [bacterium]